MVLLLLAGCRDSEPPLFEELSPGETGVDFRNQLTDTPAFNILNYLYYYDGGGVAIGDVNNDSLPDLYFTASELPNRLYLNRGNFRFEDVTETAGVGGTADWTKGAAMADVDGDGWLDLYVAAVNHRDRSGANALFINNQDGTFTDRAADFGLDFRGYSTHAAFFDYDRDGDLDLYLVNHSVHSQETYGRASLREERHPHFGDRLYRNEGEQFTDVSEEAGIYGGPVGYGLGVAVSDFDLDGWPDIYVSNDFHENDYLYRNNGDGTFTESIETAMGHTSRAAMGSDAADFDNDGRPDLVVLDMLPTDEATLKTADTAEPFDLYELKRRFGYHHQLIRNTLQRNRGRGRFSEIAPLAGVEATDWSWGPLFADFDNDGWKDLFVTNGIPRRPNDLDYVSQTLAPNVQSALERGLNEEMMTALLEVMPEAPAPNYLFCNNGDGSFTNRAEEWGLATPGFSNGAAYADLDGDGDLDLVVNHLNAPASIYRNRAETLPERHFLRIVLEGEGGNTGGLGAKVWLWHGGAQQLVEQMPTRGWQSSVEPRLHAGLGASVSVDSLLVVWPDGRFQRLSEVRADQTITLRQAEASGDFSFVNPAAPGFFEDVTDSLSVPFRHEENAFIDFNRERLLPHLVSREGPALAVGDINGDGLDDLFAGNARREAARLLLQQPDGTFRPAQDALWRADSLYEDLDAAFFDADGDGDQDLYVVSGGNEYWGKQAPLLDRLYRNDGTGTLAPDSAALPPVYANGCCVAPADYDGDGDVDLFVGSRVVAWQYGQAPPSVLLENDGAGRFADVTAQRAPVFHDAGMITDATWADIDGDGALDLIVVGEWMAPRVFVQRAGSFVEHDAGLGEATGWWYAVEAADLDADGDRDLVFGNLGLNSRLKASEEAPVRLHVQDFDSNGRSDALISYYNNGISYPFVSRDDLIQQIVSLAPRLATYADLGASRLDDLFPPAQLDTALVRAATTFASAVALNDGAGRFTLAALPTEAQYAPINAILAEDFDGDGHRDLLVAGNRLGVMPALGRYDAGYGLVLRGDGRGSFTPLDLDASGFVLDGEVRALRWLRAASGARLLVAARNDAPLQVLRERNRD